MTEELAVKIVDVMPATVPSLQAIVSKDKVELSDEEAAQGYSRSLREQGDGDMEDYAWVIEYLPSGHA